MYVYNIVGFFCWNIAFYSEINPSLLRFNDRNWHSTIALIRNSLGQYDYIWAVCASEMNILNVPNTLHLQVRIRIFGVEIIPIIFSKSCSFLVEICRTWIAVFHCDIDRPNWHLKCCEILRNLVGCVKECYPVLKGRWIVDNSNNLEQNI